MLDDVDIPIFAAINKVIAFSSGTDTVVIYYLDENGRISQLVIIFIHNTNILCVQVLIFKCPLTSI